MYIYCAQLGRHDHWARDHHQIRGVFNESSKLGEQIKLDLAEVYQTPAVKDKARLLQSKAVSEVKTDQMRSNLRNLEGCFR